MAEVRLYPQRKNRCAGSGKYDPSCMEICKGRKDVACDPTFCKCQICETLDVDLLDEQQMSHSLFVN